MGTPRTTSGTLIIFDSQAVKNTCNSNISSKGFCKYKATNRIKRHLAVDTLGLPFFTHCTIASKSDDVGLVEMIIVNIEYFKSKPVNIKKTTVFLDHGYHTDYLVRELQNVYPGIMTKLDLSVQRSLQSRRKTTKERKVLFQPLPVGSTPSAEQSSMNGQMLGWNDAIY